MLHLVQVVYSSIKKEGIVHCYIVAIKTFNIRNWIYVTHVPGVFHLAGFPIVTIFSVHLQGGRKQDFPACRLVMQADMSGGFMITE